MIRLLAPLGAAAALIAVLATAVPVGAATEPGVTHRHITYLGPVIYTRHCASGAANTYLTSMNSFDTQQGCQVSANGGLEIDWSNCDRLVSDFGTWTYQPTGQDAQGDANRFLYNGIYVFNTSIRNGVYSGTETFVDPGMGVVHQRFTARATQDANCVTTLSDWFVRTTATGRLSFLSGTTGTPLHR